MESNNPVSKRDNTPPKGERVVPPIVEKIVVPIIAALIGALATFLVFFFSHTNAPSTFLTEEELKNAIIADGVFQAQQMFTFDVPETCSYADFMLYGPNGGSMTTAQPGQRVSTMFARFFADVDGNVPWPISTSSTNYERKYSDWSEWTVATYNLTNKPNFGHFPTIEVEDLGVSAVENGYIYSVGNPITHVKVVEYGKVSIKGVKGYSYFLLDSSLYAVPNDSQWEYSGQKALAESPSDSLNIRWEYVGFSPDYHTTGLKLWDCYIRQVGKVDQENNSIQFDDHIVNVDKTVDVNAQYVTTYTEIVGYEQIREMQYRDVYSVRYRTRTILQ